MPGKVSTSLNWRSGFNGDTGRSITVYEVLSDVEAFREEIDVEEVEVPLPR